MNFSCRLVFPNGLTRSIIRNLNTLRFCLFVWYLNVLVKNCAISLTGPKTERLKILRAATHETGLGDHDFCLSWSNYTDTDPSSWERAVKYIKNRQLSYNVNSYYPGLPSSDV